MSCMSIGCLCLCSFISKSMTYSISFSPLSSVFISGIIINKSSRLKKRNKISEGPLRYNHLMSGVSYQAAEEGKKSVRNFLLCCRHALGRQETQYEGRNSQKARAGLQKHKKGKKARNEITIIKQLSCLAAFFGLGSSAATFCTS